MRLKIFLLLVLLIFLAGCSSYEFKLEMLPILRGINMGNALEAPREGEWGVVIKDEYFRIIASGGDARWEIPPGAYHGAEHFPLSQHHDPAFTGAG